MPSSSALLMCAAALSLAIGWLLLRAAQSPGRGDAVPRVVTLLARVPSSRRLRTVLGGSSGTDALVAAGLAAGRAAPLMERARVGGTLVGLAVGAAAGAVALPLLIVAPVAAILGRRAPDAAIARRARMRRAALVDALPDLLDLMVICVEAGMALDPALAMAADRLGGALGQEVRATLANQALGTARREAYRALATRTGSADVGRLVASLLQAEELGTPLAVALAGQADAMRAARRQRARDRAARAAPRIQLVVALVMVPGAMLLILGVMIVEMASQVGVAIGGP